MKTYTISFLANIDNNVVPMCLENITMETFARYVDTFTSLGNTFVDCSVNVIED